MLDKASFNIRLNSENLVNKPKQILLMHQRFYYTEEYWKFLGQENWGIWTFERDWDRKTTDHKIQKETVVILGRILSRGSWNSLRQLGKICGYRGISVCIRGSELSLSFRIMLSKFTASGTMGNRLNGFYSWAGLYCWQNNEKPLKVKLPNKT